jgi:hypothetical protein
MENPNYNEIEVMARTFNVIGGLVLVTAVFVCLQMRLFPNTNSGTESIQQQHSGKPVFLIKTYPFERREDEKIPSKRLQFLLDELINGGWGQPTAGVCLHMLRLRKGARLIDAPEFSLNALNMYERILVDDSERHSIQAGIPLILDSPYGAKMRTTTRRVRNIGNVDRYDTMAHADQILAIYFELNEELTREVITPSGKVFNTRDILNDSIATFSSGGELEWTLIAYSGYLNQLDFTNVYGRTYSIVDLTASLLDEETGLGACYGIHRLTSLAICRQRLLAELESRSMLQGAKHSSAVENIINRIDECFTEISCTLENTQAAKGYWDHQWFRSPNSRVPEQSDERDPRAASDKILGDRALVTGHLIEWMAVTPPHLRPSPEKIDRAITYLTETVIRNPTYYADKHLLAASHVFTAICRDELVLLSTRGN